MKIKILSLSLMFVLFHALSVAVNAESLVVPWADNIKVGDVWVGLEAEDQTGTEWAGPNGQATLYLFNRSVVW